MGSTNRGRLTSAVTDGRATRVVMRLGVAIELVTGLTLLLIPGVVIRALIGADEGTPSTIVGRVLGGALIGLGIAARGRTPGRPTSLPMSYATNRRPLFSRSPVSLAQQAGSCFGRWLQCTRFWLWFSSAACY
jgi:hypothetical protein